MIVLSILMLAASIILAIVVFRQGANGISVATFGEAFDEVKVANTRTKWLLYGASIVMGAYGIFWLLFGIGEMLAGDFTGIQHLVPAIMIIVLMLLAIKRPFEGGVVLIALGGLAAIFTTVIIGVPFLITGILFLASKTLAQHN